MSSHVTALLKIVQPLDGINSAYKSRTVQQRQRALFAAVCTVLFLNLVYAVNTS